MQYGKLENGYIRYAPKTVTWQGHIVNNPDAEKLRELGYLPIRCVDMPTDAPEGKHYESGWEQTEDAIVQTWTLVENEPVPEPPPTIEEQIAALQRALISQKIVGGGITNITDSSENEIKDIKIFGKSEQIQDPPPSPENPQPIKNVGKHNEETGKYEVNVVVSGGEESDRKQTVTITSDRPITRYDSLVKQDGVYGWLYGAKEVVLSSFTKWALPNDNRPDDRTRRIFCFFPDAVKNQHCYSEKYKSVEPNVNAIKTYDYECIAVANGNYLTLKVDKNIGTTLKEYVEYLKQNDSKVLYHSVNKDFVPLPEEEQILLKNLSTYYPTTVISAGDGEMYGDVELTYIADTKNYIDNQIKAVTGKQIETNKLILERMI